MKYKIDDEVEFIRYENMVHTGRIVSVKGIGFKKYRIIFLNGFLRGCEWIKEKNIIRIAKGGQA
jgi:hypothetical protein